MRSRKENCRKNCVGAYCRQHNYQLKKGMKMPAPCRGCGIAATPSQTIREKRTGGYIAVAEMVQAANKYVCFSKEILEQIAIKKEMGWTRVHNELEELPYCRERKK